MRPSRSGWSVSKSWSHRREPPDRWPLGRPASSASSASSCSCGLIFGFSGGTRLYGWVLRRRRFALCRAGRLGRATRRRGARRTRTCMAAAALQMLFGGRLLLARWCRSERVGTGLTSITQTTSSAGLYRRAGRIPIAALFRLRCTRCKHLPVVDRLALRATSIRSSRSLLGTASFWTSRSVPRDSVLRGRVAVDGARAGWPMRARQRQRSQPVCADDGFKRPVRRRASRTSSCGRAIRARRSSCRRRPGLEPSTRATPFSRPIRLRSRRTTASISTTSPGWTGRR